MATKEEKKAVEVKIKPNVTQLMATKYNLNPEAFLKTIKATVMRPGKDGRVATNEEVTAFLLVAHKYNLDPFTNEIYAFPAKKGGIIPIVGVDGFVSQMTNHPDYNGMEFEYAEEHDTLQNAKSCPKWCEVKIYRKNLEKPIVVREYLDEVYVPPRSGFTGAWQTHTKRMLRHKTIIQGARIAFSLTGIYDPDEGQRILEAEAIETTGTLIGKPEVEMPKATELPKAEKGEVVNESPMTTTEETKEKRAKKTAVAHKQQVAFIQIMLKKANIEDSDYRAYLTSIGVPGEIPSTKDIPFAKVNDAIKWIDENKKETVNE